MVVILLEDESDLTNDEKVLYMKAFSGTLSLSKGDEEMNSVFYIEECGNHQTKCD
ncbi:MAG: hypothetical protein LBI53_02545 [Candidatus Peribacteria bacterium]|jgi:hypothetical protein|nr:hypothetical protein [Candidatus Peribacteria bacterium]